MEVDEHRQLVPGGIAAAGCSGRLVHADTEVLDLVVHGLLLVHGRLAVGEGGRAEHRFRRRPEDGAVPEDSEEAEEVLDDFASRRSGGAAGGS